MEEAPQPLVNGQIVRGIHRLVILVDGTPCILVQEISEDNQRIGGIFRRLLRHDISLLRLSMD